MNTAKFLRTPFLIEHFWWLLLDVQKTCRTFPERLRCVQFTSCVQRFALWFLTQGKHVQLWEMEAACSALLSIYCKVVIFPFGYVAATRHTLGHWWEASLTCPIISCSAFLRLCHGHQDPCNKVGSQDLTRCISGTLTGEHIGLLWQSLI